MLRGATLRSIEEGHGEAAEMGTIIADAIVGFHLRTMKRLGIAYELLARESEILHLKFWDAAFAKLKEAGASEVAAGGEMAGGWIIPGGKEEKANTEAAEPESAPGPAGDRPDAENIAEKDGTDMQ